MQIEEKESKKTQRQTEIGGDSLCVSACVGVCVSACFYELLIPYS